MLILTKIKRTLRRVFSPTWLVIDKSTDCIVRVSNNKRKAEKFISENMSEFLGKLYITRAKFLCDCDYFWC